MTRSSSTSSTPRRTAQDDREAAEAPTCHSVSPATLTPRNSWPCTVTAPDHTQHYNRNAGTWYEPGDEPEAEA